VEMKIGQPGIVRFVLRVNKTIAQCRHVQERFFIEKHFQTWRITKSPLLGNRNQITNCWPHTKKYNSRWGLQN